MPTDDQGFERDPWHNAAECRLVTHLASTCACKSVRECRSMPQRMKERIEAHAEKLYAERLRDGGP